ncbi:MAG: hypothetical protein WDA23_04330 [Gemmobacter sp.]
MRRTGFIAGALLILATTGQAADTITFNLTNATGSSVTRNSTFTTCSPPGSSCTVPVSISNGTTGVIAHQAVNGATVAPLLIARYYYLSSGITKSCQLTVRVNKVSGNPTQCQPGSLSYSFLPTDGTGSSPVCGGVTLPVAPDYPDCTFVLAATMTN